MLFRSFFRPFLIFITLCLWGNAFSAPKLLHDENRILSVSQCHYLEKLAQELEQKTGFSMAVILLDDNSGKRDFLPEDNELLLYTSLKQQQHLVKLGKNVEAAITTKTIERLQQEFLFPEYRMARYDKGTLQFAYHLAKELVAKKGNSLTTSPPEFEEDASLMRQVGSLSSSSFPCCSLPSTRESVAHRQSQPAAVFRSGDSAGGPDHEKITEHSRD